MDSNQSDDQNQAVQQINNPQQPTSFQQNDQAQTAPPQQPVTVRPGGKEAAPVVVQGEVQDYVQPASHESAPVVPEAVREAGVDHSGQEDQIQLTQEDKQAGLTPAKESTPIPTNNPQLVVTSPYTLPQAEEAQGGKADNSSTWLGKLVVFVFGQQKYRKENS